MIYYSPEKFRDIEGIKAGITYAHRETYHTEMSIPGLNFGNNDQVNWPDIKSNLDRLNTEIDHTGKMALAEQVHGSNIEWVDEPGFYPSADGFITSKKRLLIGVKVADCAAVLMVDTELMHIAAIHAGWRGAASGIVGKAVNQMGEAGSKIENIRCYISPCISVANFEIGEEVAAEFPEEFIDRSIGVKPHLNLKKHISHQLKEAGVLPSSIETDARCTIEDSSFYSHRRERGKAGRMLAFIVLT